MKAQKALRELEQIFVAQRYSTNYVERRCKEILTEVKIEIGNDRLEYAKFCNAAGRVLRQVGFLDKSLELHQKALEIRELTLGVRHLVVSESLHNIGVLHLTKGSDQAAIEYFERAFQIRKRSRHPDGLTNFLVTVCQLTSTNISIKERNRYVDEYILVIKRALNREISLEINHPLLISILGIANSCLRLDRIDDVAQLGKWALPVIEEMVVKSLQMLDLDEQRDLFLTISDGLGPFLTVARNRRCEETIERLLSVYILLESLGAVRTLILRGILDVKNLDEFKKIDAQLRENVNQMSDFLQSSSDQLLDQQWYEEFGQLNDRRKKLEVMLCSQVRELSFQQMRNQIYRKIVKAQQNDAVSHIKLVRTLDCKSRPARAIFAFYRTGKEEWKILRLASVIEVETLAASVRAEITLTKQRFLNTDFTSGQEVMYTAIESPFELDAQHARTAISALLISPFKSIFENSSLVVLCPTGDLSALPFDTFFLDGELLTKNTNFVLLSSFINAIGCAKHTSSNFVLTINGGGGSLSIPDSFGVSNDLLPNLPGATNEVRIVADLTGSPLTPLNSETVRYLLSSPKADVIHIAAHSIYDNRLEKYDRALGGRALGDAYGQNNKSIDRNSLRMAALSNPLQAVALAFPSQDDVSNQFITAARIASADWSNCRLAVISGCATHAGPSTSSGHILSIASAALEAGVEMVIATLWDVDDSLAKDFMAEFYSLLDRESDARTAFHFAKRAIRNRYGGVVDWGAFILLQSRLDSQLNLRTQ